MDRVGLLPVGAQQLLAGGDQTSLQRRRPAALHQQPGLDIRLPADQPGQIRSGLIVADHGDEGRRRTQRGQIAHHVAGATRQRNLPLDRQDRHRRLQADPRYVAIGIAVEHDIADDQDIGVRQAAEQPPRDQAAARPGAVPGRVLSGSFNLP